MTTLPTRRFPITPPFSRSFAEKRPVSIMVVFIALVLSSPAHADGPTGTAPPPPASNAIPPLAANPAEMMAAMAHELDKNPDKGVLDLENITITQSEMADVIRSMPVSIASLGFAEVSRRALDVLVNQKAMVLNALKEGLDKDPAAIRRMKVLRDRVLADAWLTRKGDAAVTDTALHARYDRDIAGKPGAPEVRARLIVVPTEEEANAILSKTQAGADFAELARTYSKDGSAANGGDLGYAPLEALSPEIGAAVFALAPGQISTFPIRSPDGYFILRVEGRRQRSTPGFDEARPQLEAALRADAVRDAIQSVMARIKMKPVARPDEPAKK